MCNARLLGTFIVAIFLAGCATVPITGRKQLSLVSYSQVLALSNDSYREVISQSKLSRDSQKVQMVLGVGKTIASSAEEFMRDSSMESELKNYDWEFNLIDDDEVINAFCMPGGKIGVYTGILPVARDKNGLAAVLAHEVAHAIANHGAERMSQLLLVELGQASLSAALKNSPEKTAQLWMLAYGAGVQVGALLPYSRTHEREADRIGLFIMARAGYDPREAISFWERMSKQGGSRPPEFLSTHPDVENRIKAMREELPEALKYYK
ncbi:MAG: M48 family metallopeptidase [Candidatus Omnitrophica bacterium]|nr:M48 family metallopeptidase [Candidatus Omnitrophota bacterium]